MKIQSKRKRAAIPTSAMSDIGFLLLIFIMLVSLMNYKPSVKIEYPEALEPETTQADKNLEIWVDRSGTLYVDGIPANAQEMEDAIVEFFLKDASGRVHLKADRNVPYKHVAKAIEVLQLLEHRVVSFVVKEAK